MLKNFKNFALQTYGVIVLLSRYIKPPRNFTLYGKDFNFMRGVIRKKYFIVILQ